MATYDIKRSTWCESTMWKRIEPDSPEAITWAVLLDQVPSIMFGSYETGNFVYLRKNKDPNTPAFGPIPNWRQIKRLARQTIRASEFGSQLWHVRIYRDRICSGDPIMEIGRNVPRPSSRDLSPERRKIKIARTQKKILKAKRSGYEHPKQKKEFQLKATEMLFNNRSRKDLGICSTCERVTEKRHLESHKGFPSCVWCMNAFETGAAQ